jgi:hypothetical protein
MKKPTGIFKRVNITLTNELHTKAVVHAASAHATDFSGLVAKLLLADLRSTTAIATLPDKPTN